MYQMRNLPCRDAAGKEMPWSVCGNMRESFPDGTTINGGGVLEWCWDRPDAIQRMEMMKMDERFSDLSIQKEEIEAEEEWEKTDRILQERFPFESQS